MGRTPIARVMDCRHFDIGRRTAKPQVRPRTQSTTTGGLGFAIYSAASDRYEDAVLITGLPVGTPQEALDTACTVHLAGLGHEPGA